MREKTGFIKFLYQQLSGFTIRQIISLTFVKSWYTGSFMVNLENTYPSPRPPLAKFTPLAIAYIAGYFCFRYEMFTFIYQYSLCIMVPALISYLYDRNLLTRKRIFEFKVPTKKRLILPASIAGFIFLMVLISKIILHKELLYQFYSAGSSIQPLELSILLLIIIAPFEEIFFRGYLQHNLQNLAGNTFGPIIASLLYAVFFAFTNSGWLFIVFLLKGLCLCYLYVKCNSVFINGLIHAFFMLLLVIFKF